MSEIKNPEQNTTQLTEKTAKDRREEKKADINSLGGLSGASVAKNPESNKRQRTPDNSNRTGQVREKVTPRVATQQIVKPVEATTSAKGNANKNGKVLEMKPQASSPGPKVKQVKEQKVKIPPAPQKEKGNAELDATKKKLRDEKEEIKVDNGKEPNPVGGPEIDPKAKNPDTPPASQKEKVGETNSSEGGLHRTEMQNERTEPVTQQDGDDLQDPPLDTKEPEKELAQEEGDPSVHGEEQQDKNAEVNDGDSNGEKSAKTLREEKKADHEMADALGDSIVAENPENTERQQSSGIPEKMGQKAQDKNLAEELQSVKTENIPENSLSSLDGTGKSPEKEFGKEQLNVAAHGDDPSWVKSSDIKNKLDDIGRPDLSAKVDEAIGKLKSGDSKASEEFISTTREAGNELRKNEDTADCGNALLNLVDNNEPALKVEAEDGTQEYNGLEQENNEQIATENPENTESQQPSGTPEKMGQKVQDKNLVEELQNAKSEGTVTEVKQPETKANFEAKHWERYCEICKEAFDSSSAKVEKDERGNNYKELTQEEKEELSDKLKEHINSIPRGERGNYRVPEPEKIKGVTQDIEGNTKIKEAWRDGTDGAKEGTRHMETVKAKDENGNPNYIDRIGGSGGNYFSPMREDGSPYSLKERATGDYLPHKKLEDNDSYHKYEVKQDFTRENFEAAIDRTYADSDTNIEMKERLDAYYDDATRTRHTNGHNGDAYKYSGDKPEGIKTGTIDNMFGTDDHPDGGGKQHITPFNAYELEEMGMIAEVAKEDKYE